MINRNNIVEYISYLYQKKYNQPAPQDLLDSLSGLNDNETAIHLNGLYRHWNLDSITCKRYEEDFLNQIKAAQHSPIIPKIMEQYKTIPGATQSNTVQPPAPAPQKSSSKGFLYFLIALLVLGGVGYYVWQLNNINTDAPAEVRATDSAHLSVEQPAPVSKTIKPKEPVETEADKQNARAIHDLLFIEAKRNFDSIYTFFDANMERYWDINYPTYDEIKSRYEHTWEITENNEHQNVRVNKVADNTYDVISTYSYYAIKEEQQKRVESRVRFVFNDKNKIIKTYGM